MIHSDVIRNPYVPLIFCEEGSSTRVDHPSIQVFLPLVMCLIFRLLWLRLFTTIDPWTIDGRGIHTLE